MKGKQNIYSHAASQDFTHGRPHEETQGRNRVDPLVGYGPGGLSGLSGIQCQSDPSHAVAQPGIVVHKDLNRSPRQDVFQSLVTNSRTQKIDIVFYVLTKRLLTVEHTQSQHYNATRLMEGWRENSGRSAFIGERMP